MMVKSQSKLFQFGISTDNYLYSRNTNGDTINQKIVWSAWAKDGGATLKEEIAAVKLSADPEKLLISAYGTDSRLYTKILNSDGTSFTTWVEGAGITIKGKPVLAEIGLESTLKTFQFGYGTDNKLYSRTTTNGTSWTTWVGDSITLKDEISVSKASDYLVLSGYGIDNKLYTKILTATDSSTLSKNWQEGAGITITQEPSSTEYKDDATGNYFVFQSTKGTDGKIWTRSASRTLVNGFLVWNGWGGVTP